jgi:hypothetical protein
MPRNSRKIAVLLLLLAPCAPVVAQPASGTPGAPAPPVAFGPGVYITPKNGQTQEQLWSDRYTCDTWSKSQSGFDPARSDGGGPQAEVTTRRAAYRQALTACLEAHGYSVTGPPPPAVTSPASPAISPPVAVAAPVARTTAPSYSGPQLGYHPLTVQLQAGYSLTEGALRQALDNGGNVGLGLHWFPSSWLPLGLRVDGSYSRFRETGASLDAASAALGTTVDSGHEDLYGGDADAQLDLAHRSDRAKMYVFGGVGWYRERTELRQLSTAGPYLICGYYSCGYGYVPVVTTVARSTTPWERSWNAGLGAEFALGGGASFFIEARYLRLVPYDANNALVPIDIGLRF